MNRMNMLFSSYTFKSSVMLKWTFSKFFKISKKILFDFSFFLKALLRGALTQQSAVILVCMAVDRYTCALYPHQYHHYSSKKVKNLCLALKFILLRILCIDFCDLGPRIKFNFNNECEMLKGKKKDGRRFP